MVDLDLCMELLPRTSAPFVGCWVPALPPWRGNGTPIARWADDWILQVGLAVATNTNVEVAFVAFTSLAALVCRP